MHGRAALTSFLACLLIAGCTTDGATPASTSGEGAPGAGDPYYPNDGNGGYDAVDYQVSVSYDPATKRLDGDTTVAAKATQDLSRFNLDLRGLEVAEVQVDGAPARFAREGDFELVVTPAKPVAAGSTFHTRVRYGGTPTSHPDGSVGAGGWMPTRAGGAYALGQPHSAAFWFPVNETPRDKATFHLSVRVPEQWQVVAAGKEAGTSTDGGWTTSRWAEDNPTASYLTTVSIDRFTVDRGTLPDGTPLINAYAPGAESKRAIAARTAEVIEFLAGKFGPYPQSTAGGIYLNERIGFSLETNGRPTYAAWADLETVVHELAHQWYGNSVSVRDWSDVCLNECFASYAQWLWAEAKEGADLDAKYRAAVERTRDNPRPWQAKLHEMGQGKEFDGVYDKGILAVHALRRTVGEDVFNRVLREWPARHRGGNASWRELEQYVNEAAGRDLTPFFDAWFRGDEVPADEFLFPESLR
ncbi:M1 family metallopeptidase [Amycolatopsis suaedae]|uniref:Aminopeptidase N n=1 Tax=Amycolatopsis suaedae TaxID=2510978 RepID=A0A4Q7J2I3_9PSEU|nr:M1 family metallopeptidase [Amycolatopsis suaedae]RZQ61661.1 M1 family peptidase [Amycolatopsis suaedae]